jgi:hypothetical protein
MEWITNYWYLIFAGLIAVMFFFGYRTKKSTATNIHDDYQHGSHAGEKSRKSSHGCCH